MAISRKEQLEILKQVQESDIDYSDIPTTNTEFWQDAIVNKPISKPKSK